MSWVALGTAAVGTVGAVASGGKGGGGGAAAAPTLPTNFYGGGTGDFLVGSSKGKKAGNAASGGATVAGSGISQTTIWIIIAAVFGAFLVWRVTAKK